MKNRSINAGRFALSAIAAAAGCVVATNAWAIGLGRLSVQSSLGEALRAEIEVTTLTPEEASSLQLRVASPEAYRAAGVDYNPVLPSTRVQLQRRSDGRSVLRVTSDRTVQEPFLDVILEMSWASGRLVREYTLLLDPPGSRPAPPVLAAAPPPAAAVPPRAAAPAPAAPPAPAMPPARPAPAAPETPPPPVLPSTTRAGAADEIQVRPGDTLYRLAGRTQASGVSLDQMLVALYRSNPQAFIDNNMNRLRAGAVLSVPSADAARQTSAAEARQIIQAQSADFGAFRQRLAGVAPPVQPEAPSRQARGTVQAQVDDAKKPAAATADTLKLSQGAASQPTAAELAASQAAATRRANEARVAELTRMIDELKRTQAAAGAASVPAAATAPTLPPVPAATASAPALASAPAPIAAAPAASVPTLPPAPAASRPAPAPAPAVAEPGLLDALLENPLLLTAGGVAILLLAGLGAYRWRRRAAADGGETSFLESRLQPDSFFGVSGGQRIDTREAGAPPTAAGATSMNYSMSQLDAIGDVDPVAEADVYLAYGRDLQAEEILKEAMRSNPERLAIRSKLLEVYAKRRDTKGYELLATQLFGLTRGEGDEWQKAQELGRQIDPDNPLYRPGGSPAAVVPGSDPNAEPLGASTMPQSVLPATPSYATTTPSGDSALQSSYGAGSGPDVDIDLDLDFDLPTAPDTRRAGGTTTPDTHGAGPTMSLDTLRGEMPTSPDTLSAGALEATLPFNASGPSTRPDDNGLDFDLPLVAPPSEFATTTQSPRPPAAASRPSDFGVSAPMDLDLDDLSLKFEADDTAPGTVHDLPPPVSTFNLDDLAGGEPTGLDDGDDPLQRKLELAKEFHQIGDVEGARDLLEEVIAKADGALKARAQELLSSLV